MGVNGNFHEGNIDSKTKYGEKARTTVYAYQCIGISSFVKKHRTSQYNRTTTTASTPFCHAVYCARYIRSSEKVLQPQIHCGDY